MSFPDRQTVLDFLSEHPEATSKQEIARGLKVKGRERQTLRQILKELEAEGRLKKTGKRAWAQTETPPPTCVIRFEHLDADGELIARATGKDGPFGPDLMYLGYASRAAGAAPGIGDRGLARLTETETGVWSARLIKLFETRDEDKPLIGVFERTARGGRVTSASRRDKRELRIGEADMAGAETGDLVRAVPVPHRSYGLPHGRICDILGAQSDPRAASLLAIAAYDIPSEFPQAVLDAARHAAPAEVARADLRNLPLITIDPEDARDHDDAVYAEALDDGWRVIVAIADVAAYVTPSSALDKEARKRGNSTYFPDRVIPMLPFELSADACSLKQGVERLCLAVSMEFDTSGTKRSHRFMRAVMRSAASLSYEEAQQAIEGNATPRAAEVLDTVLRPLWGAYAALEMARNRRAPLALDLPERTVDLDADGRVVGIRTKARFDAHKLIEEMMIQANVAASEALEQARLPLLYRVHDAPSEAKIAALSEFLKSYDYKWPIGEKVRTARFNHLLKAFEDADSASAICEIVLRSQSQAIYSPENIGHFGLNLTKYAHFTSPIRRYSDMIVHRALIQMLQAGPDGLSDSLAVQLEEIAEHLVHTERRSMAAERDATDRYLALYLADRVGAEFTGRISGVTRAGLFVQLQETGADGFVPARTLSEEYWVFSETAQALIAERSGQRFEMGMAVTVRLKEVTPLEGGLLFALVSRPKPKRPGERLPARSTGRARSTDRPAGSRRAKKRSAPTRSSGTKGKRR